MRKYFLAVPIIIAGYAVVIDAYYIHTYYQVIFNKLQGAGAAQWQFMFFYAYWPVLAALLALALAYFIAKQYIKFYLSVFGVITAIPIILALLVYFKIY